MARITVAQLQARIAELEQQVAERDERIAQAVVAYKALRAQVGAARPAAQCAAPVVTRFMRGGQLIEKTRVGNRSVERALEGSAA